MNRFQVSLWPTVNRFIYSRYIVILRKFIFPLPSVCIETELPKQLDLGYSSVHWSISATVPDVNGVSHASLCITCPDHVRHIQECLSRVSWS